MVCFISSLYYYIIYIIFVFSFFYPENKSYSSVRTEALTVVDLIVKRTGGELFAANPVSNCVALQFSSKVCSSLIALQVVLW